MDVTISMKLLFGLVASALALIAANDTSIDKFKSYRSWHLVTPQPVDMTPTISLSCVGPSTWDMAPNPHSRRVFRVFVNKTGKEGLLSDGKKPFPVGSMIVKEKYLRPSGGKDWEPVKLAEDAKPELLTAMVKREKGFDPKNGDWEYIVIAGDLSKKTSEGIEHCAKCHLSRKNQGFVFGSYGKLIR